MPAAMPGSIVLAAATLPQVICEYRGMDQLVDQTEFHSTLHAASWPFLLLDQAPGGQAFSVILVVAAGCFWQMVPADPGQDILRPFACGSSNVSLPLASAAAPEQRPDVVRPPHGGGQRARRSLAPATEPSSNEPGQARNPVIRAL